MSDKNPLEKNPIYLDYAASTPVDPRVLAIMATPVLGNASSDHAYGWQAGQLVNKAANAVAALINAATDEIIWTSGATEANNLAIKGVADAYQDQGRHIITMATEHKAVLDTCADLEGRGYTITYLKPQSSGILDVADLKAAIRDDTTLISIMHVNNETGLIQDCQTIGAIAREKGILFHVDAAQSAARVAIDVKAMQIDLLSLSAHKFYGPVGIGALYVKQGVNISPLIHGGGQQRRLRPGTLPVPLIQAMGAACAIVQQERDSDNTRLCALTQRLWDGISTLPAVHLNGAFSSLAPGYLNVTFDYIASEALMRALSMQLAVSTGSACTSTTNAPSHVLVAMGQRKQAMYNTVRLSLGRMTTEYEVDRAIAHIKTVVKRLRGISPLASLAEQGVDLEHYHWERLA